LAKPTTDNRDSDIYRTRLLNLRARLRGEMGRMADAALNQGRSETSSLPIHLADLGSDNFEQELTLSLVGGEKEALDKIEVALERIADGSYGKCEDCGKKIPASRLEAIPYTTVCVQCAANQEQRHGDSEE
jgi:DnaK suppressor protein